jgi:hypothetical protein
LVEVPSILIIEAAGSSGRLLEFAPALMMEAAVFTETLLEVISDLTIEALDTF